jgi:hypothetical protein
MQFSAQWITMNAMLYAPLVKALELLRIIRTEGGERVVMLGM